MNIYIDCEWNDWKGDLISMALVDEQGREFYEVLPCDNPSPWIAQNVMPVLYREPISYTLFQQRLELWLANYSTIHLIADWPEDIAFFCRVISKQNGIRFGPGTFTMEVRRVRNKIESTTPHNALSDALALKETLE